MTPKSMFACTLAAAAAAGGCGAGDDDGTAAGPMAAAPSATPTRVVHPTATPTPDEGCRTGGVAITITGGTGVSCKRAKRIYRAHVAGRAVPKGWVCEVRACTKVEKGGGVVHDFTWKGVP